MKLLLQVLLIWDLPRCCWFEASTGAADLSHPKVLRIWSLHRFCCSEMFLTIHASVNTMKMLVCSYKRLARMDSMNLWVSSTSSLWCALYLALQAIEPAITPKKLSKYNTHYHAGHLNDPLFTAWSKLKQNIDTAKKPIEAKVQPKNQTIIHQCVLVWCQED